LGNFCRLRGVYRAKVFFSKQDAAVMSGIEAETTGSVSPPKKSIKPLHQDTRIDAAHPINGVEETPDLKPYADLDSAAVDSDAVNSAQAGSILTTNEYVKDDLASEQLQRQGRQLAEYLRNRQKELDHREAQLNAQLARFETEIRNAHIWISEREVELEERRGKFDDLEKELLERLDRLAASDAALQRQIGRGNEASDSSPDMAAREEQIRQKDEALNKRQQELEQVENFLAQAQAETQIIHEQLTAERRQLREEIHQEHQQLIARQRQGLAELEKKRMILERRGEHLDRCRAAIVQLRGELQKMHSEALEIRLATEELWIKLSGAAPPAALTYSLGQIRNRLAEQYRIANAELIEQKKELEGIRAELVGQYEKLVEQKRQFEQWIASRQGESQQQASMLIAREQALAQRQSSFEEQSQQWQVERMRYEQEIRRLRLEIARQAKETVIA
jgi:hypothetical protein